MQNWKNQWGWNLERRHHASVWYYNTCSYNVMKSNTGAKPVFDINFMVTLKLMSKRAWSLWKSKYRLKLVHLEICGGFCHKGNSCILLHLDGQGILERGACANCEILQQYMWSMLSWSQSNASNSYYCTEIDAN